MAQAPGYTRVEALPDDQGTLRVGGPFAKFGRTICCRKVCGHMKGGSIMSLLEIAVIILCVVIVLAPIAIYLMVKHSNLDGYRKRYRKANPELFWRDKVNHDS